jgi:hypothetical protein
LDDDSRILLARIDERTHGMVKAIADVRLSMDKHADQARDDLEKVHRRVGRVERRQYFTWGGATVLGAVSGFIATWLRGGGA